jgi:NAD(P)-dependent dehydrogenase (short-subunit alcohol dehydrogenase family)
MRMILRCLAAATLVVALFSAETSFAEDQKSVLITGASSGIGRNLAETLAGMGHHVYAGARKDADLAELDAIENITAVRLDVTDQEQVDAAVALIREKGTGLYGLVNNAGVGAGESVLETAIDDTQFVYAVNVEGVHRTTKAFAPLVIESKGRITTTGSIAGVLAGAGYSTYSGSKHWMEAFSDALATEMEPLGVHVSIIEPGSYKSNIRRSGWKRAFGEIEAAGGEITDEMKQAYEATAKRELSYDEPDDVTAAFVHALFDEKPLMRYLVVPTEEQGEATIRQAITELAQLNEWGPYSFSRDELVKMLDEALAR